MLMDLRPSGQWQAELDLFAAEPAPPGQAAPPALMSAVDALNQRFGRGAVAVASAMRPREAASYDSKRERMSPRYTTRLDELPVARA